MLDNGGWYGYQYSSNYRRIEHVFLWSQKVKESGSTLHVRGVLHQLEDEITILVESLGSSDDTGSAL